MSDARRVATVAGRTTEILAIALSDDGMLLATGGSESNTIQLWDAATGKELWSDLPHEGAIYSLAFTVDGKTLISGGADGKIALWDLEARKLRKKIKASKEYVVAAIPSLDGRTVYASTDKCNLPGIWDIETEKVVVEKKKSNVMYHSFLALAPMSQLLASSDGNKDVWLWSTTNGKQKLRVEINEFGGVHSLAFSPDEATLAVGSARNIFLMDCQSGSVSKFEDFDFSVETMLIGAVRFSPDGKTLVSVSDDGKTRRWDVTTGKLLTEIPFPFVKSVRNKVVLSANAKFAAIKASDTNVEVYEVPDAEPPETLNRTIHSSTECATYILFHPADLAHRKTYPSGWYTCDFAAAKDFAAGNLVAFSTGGDGGDSFRVTDGKLTVREMRWQVCKWEFRYVVRHGRVYLDNGDCLPSADQKYDSLDSTSEWVNQNGWFDIPNGNYKVTVHAINWIDEPGALDDDERATDNALPSYVICFERVSNLESIPAIAAPVNIYHDESWEPKPSGSSADDIYIGDPYVVLMPSHLLLVVPGVFVQPWFSSTYLPVSKELYDAVYGPRAQSRNSVLVIAPHDTFPGYGTLVKPTGASMDGDGRCTMAFSGQCLVYVTSIIKTSDRLTANVKGVVRSANRVPPAELVDFKKQFAKWAQDNPTYRENVKYPDFELDRIVAMTASDKLTNTVIHHIPMPWEQRLQLLLLSDQERLDRLTSLIELGDDEAE